MYSLGQWLILGNLLKMKIVLGHHPGLTDSETLGVGAHLSVLASPPGDSDTEVYKLSA